MMRINQFAKTDLQLIRRDGILLVGIVAPIILALFIRFLLPVLEQLLEENYSFSIENYEVSILAMAFLTVPSMLGMMAGFLLLDDRDEGMLAYYTVTPMRKSGYMRYRMASTLVLTFLLFFVVHLLADLVELSVIAGVLLALLFALEAPIFALILANFANNKVEGLALNKVLSVSMILPFMLLFIPGNFRLLLAIFPPFWPVMAMTVGMEDYRLFSTYLIGGVVVHALYIGVLYRMFINKTE
jgi:fluoroquinolone transport system permease protein